ncbi:MAG: glycoside hydrolase family 88 protein [Myxococcota bacterium]
MTTTLGRRPFLIGGAVVAGCASDDDATPSTPSILDESCTPGTVGANADFASQRDAAAPRVMTAMRVADHFMSLSPAEEMLWDWGDSVFMFSLVDLYRLTGEARFRDYYRAWIEHWLPRGYESIISNSDRCPPALSALALYEETCRLDYRGIVDRVLFYLDEEALRTEQGGLNHLGTSPLFAPSLWLDSLFMFGNVWTRWSEVTGELRYLDDFSDQYRIFTDLLQEDSGWMVHAYQWELAEQTPGIYWARGNAWVTAAGYDYLRVRRDTGGDDAVVAASLRAQVDAIVADQDPASGFWWTVVNRPGETYLETSASALFAAGLARGYRLGELDDSVLPVIESAVAGVLTRVDNRGSVDGISGPTMVGSFDDYAAIPVERDIHYGVGAVIIALVETSGLPTP